MNIRLLHSVMRLPAAKALAIAAAAAVATLSGGVAAAQSGLVETRPQDMSGALTLDPSTPIVSASSVRTAADVAPRRAGGSLSSGSLAPGAIAQAVGTADRTRDPLSIAQVNYGGCQSCQQSACNGGCNSHLGGGYASGGYGSSAVCGIPCDPYRYLIVEGLFMQRQGDGGFSLSRNTPVDDFDFEWAPRVTIGTLPNCRNGYEFTFTGPFEFDRLSESSDPNGNLQSFLFFGGGIDPTLLDPFNNANSHSQFHTSEYWSAEINRTIVGWDVVRILFGGKVIRIEEEYGFRSLGSNGDTAALTSSTENTLIGVQAGLDMLYPVARNVYTDFRGRAGGYLNLADSNVGLFNNGFREINTSRDDNEFCGAFEIGGGLRYQLGEILSIRGGGELWYITDTATAPNQISQAVANTLGSRIDIGEGLFYYGVNFGMELRF